MKRWKQGCLVVLTVLILAAFLSIHTRTGKMIVESTQLARIEALLEENLEATVAVGGLDYRLWRAEVTLIGVEAESVEGSWRFSIPDARVRFTPIGNVRFLARGPKVTLRDDDVGVPSPPPSATRIEIEDGIVQELTSNGLEPRVSNIDTELTRAEGGLRGVIRGTRDDTGERFESELVWDASGIRWAEE